MNNVYVVHTLSVSNISCVSCVSNLLSEPMKHNKFISKTSSVLNLLVNHFSVSKLKLYQVYQEKIKYNKELLCISRCSGVSKDIEFIKEYHSSSTVSRSNKGYQMYIKSIQEISYVLSIYVLVT